MVKQFKKIGKSAFDFKLVSYLFFLSFQSKEYEKEIPVSSTKKHRYCDRRRVSQFFGVQATHTRSSPEMEQVFRQSP